MSFLIDISDLHLVDGSVERSKQTVSADFEGDESSFTLEYDEPSEEMKGCRTKIKVTNGNSVEIIRTGAYSSVMKIEKGKRNVCAYSTPMGEIQMGFCGTEVAAQIVENRFVRLEFSYEIDTDGNLISKNKIRIAKANTD